MVLEDNCAPFSDLHIACIHCIDSKVKLKYTFSDIASLNPVTISCLSALSTIEGLFFPTIEMVDSLKDKRSPIVCRVKVIFNFFFNVRSFSRVETTSVLGTKFRNIYSYGKALFSEHLIG